MDNDQEKYGLCIRVKIQGVEYVLELIGHRDYHYWVYINGNLTDVRYPRHKEFNKNMRRYKIYQNLTFGLNVYNKEIVTKIFKEVTPENFL